tara:strand:+ start:278 stop:760 length:483 start_codon:yes stop_codon:yes gene_type:complete
MNRVENLETEVLNRLQLFKKNSNVFYAKKYPFFLRAKDLNQLIRLSEMQNIDKFRICIHKNNKEPIQEMLLVLLKPQLIKPHKQEKSIISYHVLDGAAALKIYDDNGDVEFEENLSSSETGIQHIRLEANRFRSIESLSDYFIYLEITTGPFQESDTIWL